MPYIPSPMENFNKNNPFIIIAKKEYDKIMDTLQEFSKEAIVHFMISGALLLVIIIAGLVEVFILNEPEKGIIAGAIAICIIVILLLSYLGLERRLKWYMGGHPAMMDFDRLANLEVNAILALQNEDILKALHGLYNLSGALEVDAKYFIQRMRYIICILGGSIVAYIIFIVMALIN